MINKLKNIEIYTPVEEKYNIRLDANESFINTGGILKDKISEAISGISLNRYPDSIARGAIEAFADYYGISSDNVTAGNGSDELISIITACFLEKGDTILTLSPDFSMYAFYSGLYELNVAVIEKDKESMTAGVSEIIDYCAENGVKAVIFSNPCNPTSLGIQRDEILRLLDSLSCLVILDEAYMDFWDQSVLDKINSYNNLIILKTCSKAIGLAGLRLGFAVAGKEITASLRAVKSPYNTDAVSQAAGAAVLSEKELLKDAREKIISSVKELYAGILSVSESRPALEIEKVYDTKTNFVFVSTKKAAEIHKYLLGRSISIRLLGDYLRVTAGTPEENKALLDALKGFQDEKN